MSAVGLMTLMTTFERKKLALSSFDVSIGQNRWRVIEINGNLGVERLLDLRGVIVFDCRVFVS